MKKESKDYNMDVSLTLSAEQEEFFKDSKCRKDGVLMSLYHGSGTYITEFLPEYTGQGNDQYGSGFYFSTSKEHAEGYTTSRIKGDDGTELEKLGGEDAPSLVSAYINLKNPLMVDGRKYPNLGHVFLTAKQAHKILKRLPSLYYPLDLDSDELNPLVDYFASIFEANPQTAADFKPFIEQLAYKYYSDTNMKILDIMFIKHPTEFREAVRDVLGYDGVIVDFEENKHVIAWFPEQIKAITNLKPTKSTRNIYQ